MTKKIIFQHSINGLQISPELEEVHDDMKIDLIDYNNLKKDISETGEIRDPIKIYFDKKKNALVLGGMNRLKIAKELGFEDVPVEVINLEKKDRERLVILDNLSRRQLDANSRILLQARIWSEYYEKDMKGRPEKKDDQKPFIKEIQEATGQSKRTIQREKKIFNSAKDNALIENRKSPSRKDLEKARKRENDIRKNIMTEEDLIKKSIDDIKVFLQKIKNILILHGKSTDENKKLEIIIDQALFEIKDKG